MVHCKQGKMTNTLDCLSFFRVVFMLLVFFEHYPVTPLRVGGKAVCFFFVLSGFVLSYGYGMRLGAMAYKDFLVGRMVKLYPLHWVLLPIGVWIGRDFFHSTWYHLPANIFLLQSWIPDKDSYFSGNGISWFLSTTLFLYIVFPYIWRFCSRLTIRWNLVLYAALIAVRCCLEALCTGDARIDWLYINPATRWMDFTVGVITFLVYKELLDNGLLKRQWHIIVCVCAIILTFVTFYVTHNTTYPLALFWLSYSFLICGSSLLEISCKAHAGGGQHGTRLIRIINWLSGISFSFYLLHQIVILVLYNHWPVYMQDNELVKFIVILSVCLLLAYFSFRYFEKPVAIRLRTKLSR